MTEYTVAEIQRLKLKNRNINGKALAFLLENGKLDEAFAHLLYENRPLSAIKHCIVEDFHYTKEVFDKLVIRLKIL